MTNHQKAAIITESTVALVAVVAFILILVGAWA